MPASDAPGVAPERSARRQASRLRLYKRVEGDGLAFVPWGLIPALGLAFVLLTGLGSLARSIEDRTRETAREALAEAGASWAMPRVEGQWVVLEGTPPTAEARDRAIAAVRMGRTGTWLGAARPATRVRAASATSNAPPPVSPAPGTTGQARYEWLYRLSGDTLTLQGRVPDASAGRLIVEAAGAAFAPPRNEKIVNQLTVDPGEAPEGFSNIALRGVTAIAKCTEGTASFAGARFAVRCTLPAADKDAADALARAPLPYGEIGEIELLAGEAVDRCDAALAALLGASRIEFDTASAGISASSAAILDAVAATAKDCPGTLRIDGHTDSTGLARDNLALSLARADAVRTALIARGLDENRLTANGFGSGRPLDTNATAGGRARNRRIEIRVATASND